MHLFKITIIGKSSAVERLMLSQHPTPRRRDLEPLVWSSGDQRSTSLITLSKGISQTCKPYGWRSLELGRSASEQGVNKI